MATKDQSRSSQKAPKARPTSGGRQLPAPLRQRNQKPKYSLP